MAADFFLRLRTPQAADSPAQQPQRALASLLQLEQLVSATASLPLDHLARQYPRDDVAALLRRNNLSEPAAPVGVHVSRLRSPRRGRPRAEVVAELALYRAATVRVPSAEAQAAVAARLSRPHWTSNLAVSPLRRCRPSTAAAARQFRGDAHALELPGSSSEAAFAAAEAFDNAGFAAAAALEASILGAPAFASADVASPATLAAAYERPTESSIEKRRPRTVSGTGLPLHRLSRRPVRAAEVDEATVRERAEQWQVGLRPERPTAAPGGASRPAFVVPPLSGAAFGTIAPAAAARLPRHLVGVQSRIADQVREARQKAWLARSTADETDEVMASALAVLPPAQAAQPPPPPPPPRSRAALAWTVGSDPLVEAALSDDLAAHRVGCLQARVELPMLDVRVVVRGERHIFGRAEPLPASPSALLSESQENRRRVDLLATGDGESAIVAEARAPEGAPVALAAEHVPAPATAAPTAAEALVHSITTGIARANMLAEAAAVSLSRRNSIAASAAEPAAPAEAAAPAVAAVEALEAISAAPEAAGHAEAEAAEEAEAPPFETPFEAETPASASAVAPAEASAVSAAAVAAAALVQRIALGLRAAGQLVER